MIYSKLRRMKVKISVVIITLNEERDIKRCLDSVQSIADEIVVVDSFSTDKTKEICESYSVKFIENRFEGHIQQKNFAKNQAKYDYVLSLDADEALSEELIASIITVKQNWENVGGYYVSRLTNYCDKWIKHCGWYPDTKLRLFKKNHGQWAGTNPHDRYEVNNDKQTKMLNGDLLHYSYYSIRQHIDQVNYFTDILAKEQYNTKKGSILSIIIKPFIKFIKDYWIKLGFLDGYYGFVVCSISSFATFIKYAKIRQIQKSK